MSKDEDRLLRSVREFAPRAADRAEEIETARRMPLDLVEAMRALGLFRMFVPAELGGMELAFPASLPILETLAAADASTAWLAMQGHHASILPTRLPRATYQAIYAGGADVIWANSLVPAGAAEIAPGGFRVSGRWPFASGCQHADWIFAICMTTRNGQPAASPSPGPPPLRGVVLPARDWIVEDTWRAEGLKGTGSCHIALADVFVPEASTFPMFGGEPAFAGPLYQWAMMLIPFQFASIAVGIARGAINDLSALAKSGKTYLFAHEGLKDSAVFHHELGRAEAELLAARALLHEQAWATWSRAASGELDDVDAVRGAQVLAWAAAACARVVDICFTLGGGSSVYDESPLQRRLRDVHAVTQHATLNQRQYAFAGAVLAGHPARNPLGG